MIKNVKLEVKGPLKSGSTLVADLVEDALNGFGLTVVRNGDVIVVSGEVATSACETNCCEEAENPKPQSALAVAHQIVHGDREQTYGDAGKNFRTIATYWATHLKAAYSIDVPLTEADVCGMMILLKQARLANNPSHRDSKIDIAGYTELNDIIQQQNSKA